MLMHRETNNIIKIFYDISKRLADKTVQCIITATNKYDFLEKGGQNNLQWHKNTNQERRQDLRTAAICFLWTAFGLLKHIHLKICCQKTYKTLYRKNCFCLVITHNLSLCRQSETAVGENSPVAGGDAVEQRDNTPITERQWLILLAALQNISQTELC